jgi:hypothetical protein
MIEKLKVCQRQSSPVEGDPNDWHSYPKVNSPIQVKYAGGRLAEGTPGGLLSLERTISESPVVGWRYIEASAVM